MHVMIKLQNIYVFYLDLLGFCDNIKCHIIKSHQHALCSLLLVCYPHKAPTLHGVVTSTSSFNIDPCNQLQLYQVTQVAWPKSGVYGVERCMVETSVLVKDSFSDFLPNVNVGLS